MPPKLVCKLLFTNLMQNRVVHPLALALAAILTLGGIPSCSSVGPLPCSSSHIEKNSSIKAPTSELLNTAYAEYQRLKHSKSPANIARYNEACEALLLQDYCKDKNLSALPPSIGSWYQLRTNGCPIPSFFDGIYPASHVYAKKVFETRIRLDGVGVPLVGWKDNPQGKPSPPDFMAPSGRAYDLTAILSFDEGKPVWKLHQAEHSETVKIGSTTHQLRGDLTAANAVFWARSDLRTSTIKGVLKPFESLNKIGLYMDAPYDPNKIPVICVHGLKSSPIAFLHMTQDLRQDKVIRENYQFIYFYYPTGTSWLLPAATFREKVRDLESYAHSKGGGEKFEQMVILSHSMGGLITRASTCVSPKPFYDILYSKDIDQLSGSKKDKDTIRRILLYEPLRAPKRVVFMATPHKGSEIAAMNIVELLSKVITFPISFTQAITQVVTDTGANLQGTTMREGRLPTSLDQLNPQNKAILTVPKLEFPSHLKVHSIIGAHRGNPESDGVVPYWSSHLPPAQTESELIINSNHSVPGKKEAATEVDRILKLHLKELGRR